MHRHGVTLPNGWISSFVEAAAMSYCAAARWIAHFFDAISVFRRRWLVNAQGAKPDRQGEVSKPISQRCLSPRLAEQENHDGVPGRYASQLAGSRRSAPDQIVERCEDVGSDDMEELVDVDMFVK